MASPPKLIRARMTNVADPRSAGMGIRSGIGDPSPYCDCSQGPDFVSRDSWMVVVLSLQYLVAVCRKHCRKAGGSYTKNKNRFGVKAGSGGNGGDGESNSVTEGIVDAIRRLALKYSTRSGSEEKSRLKKQRNNKKRPKNRLFAERRGDFEEEEEENDEEGSNRVKKSRGNFE